MNRTFSSLAEDPRCPPPRVGTRSVGSQPEIGSPVAPAPEARSWAGRGRPQALGKVLRRVPGRASPPRAASMRGPGRAAPGAGWSGPGARVPSSRGSARVAGAGSPRVKCGYRCAAGDPTAGSRALSTGHRLSRGAAGDAAGTRERGGGGGGRGGGARSRPGAGQRAAASGDASRYGGHPRPPPGGPRARAGPAPRPSCARGPGVAIGTGQREQATRRRGGNRAPGSAPRVCPTPSPALRPEAPSPQGRGAHAGRGGAAAGGSGRASLCARPQS